jgi:hypothetical protein
MKSNHVPSAIRAYLIVFAASALPFGLISGLAYRSAAVGLVGGVIFGVAFTLIVGTAAVAGHRGRGGPVSPRQRIALRLDADVDLVRRRAVEALGRVSPRPVGTDGPGRLVVRVPMSLRSVGEVVGVEIRADGPATDVVISSRPVVPVTVADYGKGRDNVETVERGLRL